jgi:hypothetical protein
MPPACRRSAAAAAEQRVTGRAAHADGQRRTACIELATHAGAARPALGTGGYSSRDPTCVAPSPPLSMVRSRSGGAPASCGWWSRNPASSAPATSSATTLRRGSNRRSGPFASPRYVSRGLGTGASFALPWPAPCSSRGLTPWPHGRGSLATSPARPRPRRLRPPPPTPAPAPSDDLIDLEDGDALHWRREGERWEPPIEETYR